MIICSKAYNVFSPSATLGGHPTTKAKACYGHEKSSHHGLKGVNLKTEEPYNGCRMTSLTDDATSVQKTLTRFRDGSFTEKFNWFKNWWAAQALDNLESDRPNKITLLGKDFVVWKGHSGDWLAMDDQCPHRLAPLSQGRIEQDGNLLCCYHAWRFNESGKCVKIPYAKKERAHFVACSSPRSAVQTYPCKTRGAILWIWPDTSTSAFSDSEKASIPIEDDLADFLERSYEDGTYFPFFQILPFGYESMVENAADPVHLNATHHGVLPALNRYKSQPLRPKIVKRTSGKQGVLSIDIDNPPFPVNTRIDLELPGTIMYSSKGDKRAPGAAIYATYSPTRARESLSILAIVQHYQLKNRKQPNFVEKALNRIAALMIHLLHLRLSDADIAILNSQDQCAREKGASFSSQFYVPTNADILTTAFRKWFENAGDHGAAYGGDIPVKQNTRRSREQLMDRYESHTKQCKLCSSTLKTTETAISVFEFVRLASVVVGSVGFLRSLTMGSVSLGSILKSAPKFCSVLVLFFTTVVLHLLQKLRSQFYYVGYDFTEMN